MELFLGNITLQKLTNWYEEGITFDEKMSFIPLIMWIKLFLSLSVKKEKRATFYRGILNTNDETLAEDIKLLSDSPYMPITTRVSSMLAHLFRVFTCNLFIANNKLNFIMPIINFNNAFLICAIQGYSHITTNTISIIMDLFGSDYPILQTKLSGVEYKIHGYLTNIFNDKQLNIVKKIIYSVFINVSDKDLLNNISNIVWAISLFIKYIDQTYNDVAEREFTEMLNSSKSIDAESKIIGKSFIKTFFAFIKTFFQVMM